VTVVLEYFCPKCLAKFGVFCSKYCQFLQNFNHKIGIGEKRHFFPPKIGKNRDHNIDPRGWPDELMLQTFHAILVQPPDVLERVLGGRDQPRAPLLQPPVVVELLVEAVVGVALLPLAQAGQLRRQADLLKSIS
jgi:hypothetical protein